MESFRSIPFQEKNHLRMHIDMRPFLRGSIGHDGSFQFNKKIKSSLLFFHGSF